VAGPDLELVEEPLAGSPPLELARLRRATGVPIGLDESVVDMNDLERFDACEACDAVVLKLARLGGPRAAVAIARRARELGLEVTWTDSIETRVGRQATLHAAAADGPVHRRAVGLGGAVLLVEPGVPEDGARVDVLGPGLGPR
ncbi:MAG: enolase C-terminal domain-like protein, partial [Alphaproteobacteria bacterium]